MELFTNTADKNKQYLTFCLHDSQYGIETALVQEMFPLPELTPIAEVSTEIIGIINLRGQIVPIMHLDLNQENSVTTCNLSDYLIVLQWDGFQVGLVVHQVNKLVELSTEVIETDFFNELITDVNSAFITGMANVDTDNIFLLDPKQFIPQLDAVLSFIWDAQMQIDAIATSGTSDAEKQRLEIAPSQAEQQDQEEYDSLLLVEEAIEKSDSLLLVEEAIEKSYSSLLVGEAIEKSDSLLLVGEAIEKSYSSLLVGETREESCSPLLVGNSLGKRSSQNFYELYCPHSTLKERKIFRQRADNFRQPIDSVKLTDKLLKLAVIDFGNEYFGVELEVVRTFTNISNLTPIPGCPKHIVGNMNWRGEIVTLVDIRELLNLPTSTVSIGSPVVVIQVEEIVAGLPVDQVLEMAYLNLDDLIPSSEMLSDFSEQYLQGTAFFQEKILRVLDLPKIFTQGELAVNEEA